MAPHSSTLAWKIQWMEEPGRLQSMGSLQVGHDWATSLSLFTFTHWRRKWQPTPVFLPGEAQGRGSLVGCRLWGPTESDTTEATWQQQQQQQYSLCSQLYICECVYVSLWLTYFTAMNLYLLSPSPISSNSPAPFPPATASLFSRSLFLFCFVCLYCFLDSTRKCDHTLLVFCRGPAPADPGYSKERRPRRLFIC